ncbi:MAG: metallophosphoesterase [Candidatus Acidiferrales bacterium]
MTLDRRIFLKTLAAAGTAMALPPLPLLVANDRPAPGSFDFVFFTDTHIQPELDAAHGCDMCFRKIAATQSDFAVMGGDHVYDAFGVNSVRARMVFDLYSRTEQLLGMPLHNAIGNHDVFGVLTKSGVAPTDPAYGKKMYQDRMGATFYSFDHKGYHFVVLDSIHPTDDRLWEARIGDDQLQWLRDDLKKLPAGAPVLAVVHCPIVTAFATYAEIVTAGRKYNTMTVSNAPEVLEVLAGANVIAVLQGHTHVNESVTHKNTQFITSGAVCGNWWHGSRLGTPEGYTVVSLREGKISTRYETYGFQSVARNDSWRPGT